MVDDYSCLIFLMVEVSAATDKSVANRSDVSRPVKASFVGHQLGRQLFLRTYDLECYKQKEGGGRSSCLRPTNALTRPLQPFDSCANIVADSAYSAESHGSGGLTS
ncbi:hypothetical protein RF11_02939 [Thelohanellus kitauei]|uniref:Uncharacterized protein n=1 Tax=Thelohanellus kitauei TaxID=669202 RepID=A0A0C2JUA5_THEKT|nr:hypothetical protein RF11_02939 [Thelohanellus kitauei]